MENIIRVGDAVTWTEADAKGCFSSKQSRGVVTAVDGDKLSVDAGWGTLHTEKQWVKLAA